MDVSELEELLEAAGEKVNPLELESVFQVGMSALHFAFTRISTQTKQEFDADGSGFITVDEFLNTMHKRWLRQNEAEIDLAEGTPPNQNLKPPFPNNSSTLASQPSPS